MNSPKIGIAPETVSDDQEIVLRDQRPARVRRHQHPAEDTQSPRLLIVGKNDPEDTVVGFDSEGGLLCDSKGAPLLFPALTWPKYLEWRKTKCRPYDASGYHDATLCLPVPTTEERKLRDRALEEIDQAIHEFVGEVAELGELFLKHGPSAFYAETRDKLIDECGDIFFCGAWVFDAWGRNPLADADDLELIRVGSDNELAQMAEILGTKTQQELAGNRQFVSVLQTAVAMLMLHAQSAAGLLCNSFKKLRYQRREQDVDVQVARVCTALLCVNQILVIANSSVEEALTVNQRKLDARYPNGYQAGQGGGDRTGEGA